MKKVLVTGGNGYIGKHVTNTLLNRGYDTFVVDHKLDDIDFRAKVCNTDIFSGSKTIYSELGNPDICIHMAWRDGFVHNSSRHMLDLSKHYEFIENMIEGGLRHIVVIGTMHEIGYWEGKIDENTPCNPMSMYGVAKNSLRKSLEIKLKDKGITFQWLRLYYITGDDAKSNSIFTKINEMEAEGKGKFPFTTGKNKYDFIDVKTLAKQIAIASTQSEIDGIINCCSGKAVTLAEKVESYIKENDFKIKLEYGAFPDREYDSPCIYGDNLKIEEILKNNL